MYDEFFELLDRGLEPHVVGKRRVGVGLGHGAQPGGNVAVGGLDRNA